MRTRRDAPSPASGSLPWIEDLFVLWEMITLVIAHVW